MGVLADIAETYIRPARVIRRKAARGVSERQLLAWLMAASLIALLARLPGVTARADETQPREALAAAAIIAGLLFAPLFFYALAAISRLGAWLLGGRGSGQGARLALFWALLALQPLVIAAIYLPALLPAGLPAYLVTIPAGLWFLWVWLAGLGALEIDAARRGRQGFTDNRS